MNILNISVIIIVLKSITMILNPGYTLELPDKL